MVDWQSVLGLTLNWRIGNGLTLDCRIGESLADCLRIGIGMGLADWQKIYILVQD